MRLSLKYVTTVLTSALICTVRLLPESMIGKYSSKSITKYETRQSSYEAPLSFWESQSQVLPDPVGNMSQVMVTCHSHRWLNIVQGTWVLPKHVREVVEGKGKHMI